MVVRYRLNVGFWARKLGPFTTPNDDWERPLSGRRLGAIFDPLAELENVRFDPSERDWGGIMDIHKPKAARSFREFLVEIGTIVIGILIALGLEQAIEVIHERKIADEAREAVRAEVRENLWWLEVRGRREACTVKRYDELADLLDRARAGRPYAAATNVGMSSHSKITSLRWEANAQAGRLSLFTAQEQRSLGNEYFTFSMFARAQDNEEDALAKLDAIVGLDRLTPAEIDQFRTLLAEARHDDQTIIRSMLRAHQQAGLMHLSAENIDDLNLGPNIMETPVCRSITAPPPPQ